MTGDTQTAEGWYQSYVEAHKRAVKAEARLAEVEAERDAMERRARAFEQGAEKLQAERDALRKEVSALKDINWDISYPGGESLATLKSENNALTAQVARLYGALEAVCNAQEPNWHMIEKLLAETPAQSLSAVRNKALEDAAKEVDVYKHTGGYTQERDWANRLFPRVQKAIRAMKTEADNDGMKKKLWPKD